MKETNRNITIDILKFIFAVAIVSLHVHITGIGSIVLQCFSRIGVPFFFAVTGYYIMNSDSEKLVGVRVKKYVLHSAKLLFVWYTVYFPLILRRYNSTNDIKIIVKEFLFKAPAFLWFLPAGIVGILLLYFLKNKLRLAFIISICLWVIGTVGNSYLVFWSKLENLAYYDLFITTRNGLFYAFPIMTFTVFVMKSKLTEFLQMKKWQFLFVLLYIAEVFLVNCHAGVQDTSMYFMLPIITCIVFNAALNSKLKRDNFNISHLSTGIYVMQFGLITVLGKVLHISAVGLWIIVTLLAVCLTYLLIQCSLLKKIFL